MNGSFFEENFIVELEESDAALSACVPSRPPADSIATCETRISQIAYPQWMWTVPCTRLRRRGRLEETNNRKRVARDGHEVSLLNTSLVWLASWRVSPELGLTRLARGEVSHRCPHSYTSEADVWP